MEPVSVSGGQSQHFQTLFGYYIIWIYEIINSYTYSIIISVTFKIRIYYFHSRIHIFRTVSRSVCLVPCRVSAFESTNFNSTSPLCTRTRLLGPPQSMWLVTYRTLLFSFSVRINEEWQQEHGVKIACSLSALFEF